MERLRGRLLIASPALVDPSFRRTVILVVEHGDEGAMGLVLNRPSPALVAEAVPPLAGLVEPDEPVWVGGPVQPESVVVLAEWDDLGAAGPIVLGDVGFMPSEADPALVAAATRRVRVFAGYAGWSPGQLEAELEDDSWIVEEALPEDAFAAAGDLFAEVLRRRGGQFRVLALMPEDPSLN